jgi:hypothetical protein
LPNVLFEKYSNIELNEKFPNIRIFTFKEERKKRGIEMRITRKWFI